MDFRSPQFKSLSRDALAGEMETVQGGLRHTSGRGNMPRTLNVSTGPSRSGDIERKVLLGARGPRGVHVIVVER